VNATKNDVYHAGYESSIGNPNGENHTAKISSCNGNKVPHYAFIEVYLQK
jgi:hypothetical protein